MSPLRGKALAEPLVAKLDAAPTIRTTTQILAGSDVSSYTSRAFAPAKPGLPPAHPSYPQRMRKRWKAYWSAVAIEISAQAEDE